MKRLLAIVLVLALPLALLSGCGSSSAPAGPTTRTLKVGASITPHAEVLEAAREDFEAKGYKLEIVEYTDYVQPNLALDAGDLDANYFQHVPYLEGFNNSYNTSIAAIALVHYEAFGIYPGRSNSLSNPKDGASVAIPNDGTNQSRALLLMQANGLITLKEGAGLETTVFDIVDNPYNLVIHELEAAQITHALPDVDYGVVNFNYAQQAGLKASVDALAIEDKNSVAADTYANVVCVKEGNEKDEAVIALIEAIHTEKVRNFILEAYGGAVVPKF